MNQALQNDAVGRGRPSPSLHRGSDVLDRPNGKLFRIKRRSTSLFKHTTRRKPRSAIVVPVVLHALFAALIVFVDTNLFGHLGLPPSIIPSLSIVVGLMLVFRNQTSYNRFWDGRNQLTVIITSIRNLTRVFLTCSMNLEKDESETRDADREETERVVKLLIAILCATKNHLRENWGAFLDTINLPPPNGAHISSPEYADLLPPGLVGYDYKGLGIPLQFTMFVEQYIKKGSLNGWWQAPSASQLTGQLNSLVDAYGKMETIRLTPVPVAHLIHQKQVLALFGMVLPFAMVDDMGWLAVPITTLVVFTLYGIDGIATELEDPFGYDKIDIDLDGIVEDIRAEVLVLIDEWKRVGESEENEWFVDQAVGEPLRLRGPNRFRMVSFSGLSRPV